MCGGGGGGPDPLSPSGSAHDVLSRFRSNDRALSVLMSNFSYENCFGLIDYHNKIAGLYHMRGSIEG